VQRENRTIPVVFANVSDPSVRGSSQVCRDLEAISRACCCSTEAFLVSGFPCSRRYRPRLRRAVLMIDPKTTPLDYFYRPAEAVAPSLCA